MKLNTFIVQTLKHYHDTGVIFNIYDNIYTTPQDSNCTDLFCGLFQSLLDFSVSVVLLLSTLTVKDPYKVHNGGILGWMECRMWNTKFLLWGLFVSSTWNIVLLTFER